MKPSKHLGRKPPEFCSCCADPIEDGNITINHYRQALIEAAEELEKWNATGKNIIGSDCRYKEVTKIIKSIRISAGQEKGD